MADQQGTIDQFTNSFAKVLNRHGYGFQFSILRKADELIKQRRCVWKLEACEFPVEFRAPAELNRMIEVELERISKQKEAKQKEVDILEMVN